MAQMPQKTPIVSETQTSCRGLVAVNALPVAHHPNMTDISECQERPVMEMLSGKGADASVPYNVWINPPSTIHP
jgi:hypothetical protein